MTEESENLKKFKLWYVEPIEKLDGNASFVTLAVALFLFERYYRIKSTSQSKSSVMEAIEAASIDLDINKDFLYEFWTCFRHGLMHQGTPKSFISTKNGIEYKWRIGGYKDLPTEFKKNGARYICLNPGGFYRLIRDKYLESEEALEGIVDYHLGSIFEEESEPEHHQPKLADIYP